MLLLPDGHDIFSAIVCLDVINQMWSPEVFLPQLLYPNPFNPLNGELVATSMMCYQAAYEQRVKGLKEIVKIAPTLTPNLSIASLPKVA